MLSLFSLFYFIFLFFLKTPIGDKITILITIQQKYFSFFKNLILTWLWYLIIYIEQHKTKFFSWKIKKIIFRTSPDLRRIDKTRNRDDSGRNGSRAAPGQRSTHNLHSPSPSYGHLSSSDPRDPKIPEAMEDEAQPSSVLPRTKSPTGGGSAGAVELRAFEYCLRWMCVDQSTPWKAVLSWSVFFLLTVAVPLASLIGLQCSSTCDANHRRPYQAVVQTSLSVFAAISFICLSRWARKYGLRHFLFLDKLPDASDLVRRGYAQQLQVNTSAIIYLIKYQSFSFISFWFHRSVNQVLEVVVCKFPLDILFRFSLDFQTGKD